MLPVGIALPLEAFTVAVRTVVDAFAPGFADTAIVVLGRDAATLTVAEDAEFVKLPVAE
jgi:hypothetical protein